MANLDLRYAPEDRTTAFQQHERGTLVALAGPGTGKTHNLLARVRALFGRQASADSICYLTFIKEISLAFEADYIDEFGQEAYEAEKPRISTLHSFACRLLRNQGFRIGYGGTLFFTNVADPKSTLADTFLADLLPLVTSPLVRTIPQLRDRVTAIKGAWRDLIQVGTLEAPLPAVAAASQQLLRGYRLLDWDQTVPLAHGLVNEEPPGWVAEIRHYLIDEYQDFNRSEQELIACLARYADSVVIVGDDDQCLYKSRGGSPEGLRAAVAVRENDQVSLVICYRCKRNIVTTANTFLATTRSDPRIMRPHADGGDVLCYRFKSTKAELAYLRDFLTVCLGALPENPRSKDGVVCLFPSWKVLDFYHDRLAPHLPCIRRKAAIPEMRAWLSQILHLLCTPDQRFSQRLLLNSYQAIHRKHLRRLVEVVLERDVSPADAIGIMLAEGFFKGAEQDDARQFCELIRIISARDHTQLAPNVAVNLGMDVAQVSSALEAFVQDIDDNSQDDSISRTCDALLPDTATPPEDRRAVLFLTIHGSKGLTKKIVVIPGLEQAWLPGQVIGDDLAEKRRLFFVAITRATDRVLLTYPRTRGKGDALNYGAFGAGEPSSFLGNSGLRATAAPAGPIHG